jgi:hypothetical protein
MDSNNSEYNLTRIEVQQDISQIFQPGESQFVQILEDAISHMHGAKVAEAILRDNALRVLRQGWHGGTVD